jgi:hypothetical protein
MYNKMNESEKYLNVRNNIQIFKDGALQNIKDDVNEVLIYTVASMCDNKYTFKFFKNDKGQFRVSAGIHSMNNFGMKNDFVNDLEWSADEGNWENVIDIINEGYQLVYAARSR